MKWRHFIEFLPPFFTQKSLKNETNSHREQKRRLARAPSVNQVWLTNKYTYIHMGVYIYINMYICIFI